MTQPLSMFGPSGQQVQAVGPAGPVNLVLGVGGAPSSQAVLMFNTITAGAAGSGRLIDFPLLTVPTGTLAFTGNAAAAQPSVHAYWQRMTAPSSVSSDSISILKPLGGASREIWVRLVPDLDPYWQQRLTSDQIAVDGVAGNDENFGNAANPLLTEAEAFRRLGRTPAATFVFQPGGSAQGNVYTSWTQLVAATALIPGPKTIVFDDTFGAISIPAGAYDFGQQCVFEGLTPAQNSTSTLRVTVTCPDGVTFTTPIYALRDINLTYTGTHSLMTVSATQKTWCYVLGSTVLTATGAAGSIFAIAGAAANFTLAFLDFSFASVSGGGFIFTSTATAGSIIALRATSTMFDLVSAGFRLPSNSLSGAAGPTYSFCTDVPGMFSTTQGSMPGGVITVDVNQSAPFVTYTPTTPLQWGPAGIQPATALAALDKLQAGSGPEFYPVAAVGNLAGGGAIGTAANTVDQFRGANCAQTTAAQTLTIPNPTTATANQRFTVSNTGSASFTMLGATVAAGGSLTAIWTGAAWSKVS